MGHEIFSEEEWGEIWTALRLPPREVQVIQHIVDDEPDAAVARALGISTSTVHTYLRRLYRRLGVHGRTALVVRVFETHLALLGRVKPPIRHE